MWTEFKKSKAKYKPYYLTLRMVVTPSCDITVYFKCVLLSVRKIMYARFFMGGGGSGSPSGEKMTNPQTAKW